MLVLLFVELANFRKYMKTFEAQIHWLMLRHVWGGARRWWYTLLECL